MKLSKRQFLASATAALAPGAVFAGTQGIALPQDLGYPDYTTITSVQTSLPQLALTFDDGPHPSLTPQLLDMLAARGLKATFYLIGNRVATWPEIAARIAREGHEIGNHSWSHPFLDRYSDAAMLRQIDRTNAIIADTTGKMPVTFRPPYGAFTQRQRRLLHDARGMPSVLWSVDPRDWRRPGAQVVANRILGASHAGSIVLSHDIHPGTVRAMPQVMDTLVARGLTPTTISELIGWPAWSTRQMALR